MMRHGVVAIGLVGMLWGASAQATETRQLGNGHVLRPVSGSVLEIRRDGKRLWSCIPRDGDREETECKLARILPRIMAGAVLIHSADIRGRVPNTCTLVVAGTRLETHSYPSWQSCADTVKDVDGDGIGEFLTPSTHVPRSLGAEDDYPFSLAISSLRWAIIASMPEFKARAARSSERPARTSAFSAAMSSGRSAGSVSMPEFCPNHAEKVARNIAHNIEFIH
ncbi:hypothetical protein [Paramagnetospirillum marisnigri]|uniref:hypothetical protein n=1 Tax=Paramagnetospirillum marisnigri TaxID=1285242 RepID=UPI0008388800|nr:hypothetical protein [Paramagnetospirillum marisnigri]